jgi:serine protease Do
MKTILSRPQQSKTSRRCWTIGAGLWMLLVAGTAVAQKPTQPEARPARTDVLKEVSDATARVVREVSPSVVGLWVDIKPTIEVTALEQPAPGANGGAQDPAAPQLPRGQFPQLVPHEQALGSGFIVSKDGDILTNNHVVGNADMIRVTLNNDRRVPARVVGTDPATDLAVIQISGAQDLPALEFGDSDSLRVGDWVVAIGQPFGLSHTVTGGIVSALGRNNMNVTAYEDFIQTDAAINPGSSGGPLVNQEGKVVGVNTMIIGSKGNIGIGFAIPAAIAKNVYQQIKAHGKVTRGYIGIDIQDVTPELAAAFGLPEDTMGIMIAHVADGSPGAAAGLKQGDIIVKLEGQAIHNAGLLQMRVSMLQPGTSLSVSVRGGEAAVRDLNITMGTKPEAAAAPPQVEKQPTLELLGMVIQDATPELRKRLDLGNLSGVLVVAVADDSIPAAAGIIPGTLIQEVARQPVSDVKTFAQAMEKAAAKPPVLLLVNMREAYRYIVLAPPGE